MSMVSNQKEAWFDAVSQLADDFDELLGKARSISAFFHDNSMGSGGTNELIDADTTGTRYEGVSAAQMAAAGVTVTEAFDAWYDSGGRMPIMAAVKKSP